MACRADIVSLETRDAETLPLLFAVGLIFLFTDCSAQKHCASVAMQQTQGKSHSRCLKFSMPILVASAGLL